MSEHGSITLVPSVHFSATHRRRVRDTIRETDPDLVAIELGERRYDQLEENSRLGQAELAEELPPATAAAYRSLKAIQQTVVRLYGLDPAKTDMETAVETAADLDTRVALIDEPITRVFAALSTRVGLETIPKVLIRTQLIGPGDRMTQFQLLGLPFKTVDSGDDVQPAIDYLRRYVPEVTDVLIDRRDRMMAHRLYKLRREGYDVVAVIGAGHHNGIRETLDELETRESETDVDVPIRTPTRQVTEIPIN